MISHQHRCIFIHISKCAGSTVEAAFYPARNHPWKPNYEFLFGWCSQRRIFLQHATPQQLIDTGLITRDIWNQYYKFIVVRNPWARTFSDYLWVMLNLETYGTFDEFVRAEGKLGSTMMARTPLYRGDHLYRQIDYLHLDGTPVSYNRIVRFESLQFGLDDVAKDLGLPEDLFRQHREQRPKNLRHYSHFYNNSRKRLVDEKYGVDASFLGYQFEDQHSLASKIKAFTPVLADLGLRRFVKLRFPLISSHLRSIRPAQGAYNKRHSGIL